jgi:hypothetical protein
VDVVARLRDRLQQGDVLRRAVHQQVGAGGGDRRQAGGRLREPRQFDGIRRGHQAFRRRRQIGAGAHAAQALATDALRPEEEIDDEADVRQCRQADQPAQRGHRLALLQHDPQPQPDEIGQPAKREVQTEVGYRGERAPRAAQDVEHAGRVSYTVQRVAPGVVAASSIRPAPVSRVATRRA